MEQAATAGTIAGIGLTLTMSSALADAIQLLSCSNSALVDKLALMDQNGLLGGIALPPMHLVRSIWSGASSPVDVTRFDQANAPSGLIDHVMREIGLLKLTAAQLRISEFAMERLEPTGWLGATTHEIAAAAEVDEEEVEATIARLQEIEPTGLFARSLSECLHLQARESKNFSPAFEVVLDNLPMLARRDFAGLVRMAGCDEAEITRILAFIRGMDPKPGLRFEGTSAPRDEPDLIIRLRNGVWHIDHNRGTLPTIRIADNPPSKQKKPGTSFLQRALVYRADLLLRVGRFLSEEQPNFLKSGAALLRPMTLSKAGEQLDVHQTTIGRLASAVLVDAPFGCFQLRKAFSRSLAFRGRQEGISTSALKVELLSMLSSRNDNRPMSDEDIARRFRQKGVTIARRTIAKYRLELNIPRSSARLSQHER